MRSWIAFVVLAGGCDFVFRLDPIADPRLDTAPLCSGLGYMPISSGEPGSTYRHDKTPVSWLMAEAACEAEGTHLVVIGNADERDAVVGLIGTGPVQIWIGSSDRITETIYRDVTGDVTAFLVWDPTSSQPDPEDCLLMRGDRMNYQTRDCTEATTPQQFVCECDNKTVDQAAF